MMVAAPHIDLLLSGHDLRSLEELARRCCPVLELEVRTMRWSVGLEAEGDRVLTREEIVELADAVATHNGIATGIGSTRYGAQLIVEADERDEAIEQATATLPRRGRDRGTAAFPIVRAEAISEAEDDEDWEP